MDSYTEATDRTAGDYLLFAVAFIALLLALTGVTIASPALAFAGGQVVFLCVAAFAMGQGHG